MTQRQIDIRGYDLPGKITSLATQRHTSRQPARDAEKSRPDETPIDTSTDHDQDHERNHDSHDDDDHDDEPEDGEASTTTSESETEEGLIIDASDDNCFSGPEETDHEIAKNACSGKEHNTRERLLITIENRQPQIGRVEMSRDALFALLCDKCHEATLHKIDEISNLSKCQWCENQYSSLDELLCRNFERDRQTNIVEFKYPVKSVEAPSPVPTPAHQIEQHQHQLH